jgi:hypothetical protein
VAIEYRIQATPQRAEYAEALASLVTPALVVYDDSGRPWEGYKKCLQNLSASHVCVLQEDVQLCRSFTLALDRIAAARPDQIVSLFTGGIPGPSRQDFYQAQIEGRSYSRVVNNQVVNVVSLLWPRPIAEQFLAWAEVTQIPGPVPPHADDAVVGWFALEHNLPIVQTVPCLVEHRHEVPSVVNSSRHPDDTTRKAIGFIGDADPLEVDWRQ